MPDDFESSGRLVSPKTVSDITHLTPLEIRQLVRSGHLPKAKAGRYDLPTCVAGALRWYNETRHAPATIFKDELSRMSGLSDSSHRKLAAKGTIPAPVKGHYQLIPTCAGLIQYYRHEYQQHDKLLAQKRERKLDNENTVLELDIAARKGRLVSIDDMDTRMRPMLEACRQKVLGSSMTDDEKDQLISEMGTLLDHALTRHNNGSTPNTAQALATDLD
jgi:hypothetical protein